MQNKTADFVKCCGNCKNSDFCYQNTGVCMFYEYICDGDSEAVTDMFEDYKAVQETLK